MILLWGLAIDLKLIHAKGTKLPSLSPAGEEMRKKSTQHSASLVSLSGAEKVIMNGRSPVCEQLPRLHDREMSGVIIHPLPLYSHINV